MTSKNLLHLYQGYTKGKTPQEASRLWEEYRKLKKELELKSIKKNKKKNKKTLNKEVPQIIQTFSNDLTQNATKAEKAYMEYLQKKKIRFKFQKPIKINKKWYIMDFFLYENNMCIEIDGGYHNSIEQKTKDEERDKDLLSKGIITIRYTNEEVFNL